MPVPGTRLLIKTLRYVFLTVIRWIVIYPFDSVIHSLNNWALIFLRRWVSETCIFYQRYDAALEVIKTDSFSVVISYSNFDVCLSGVITSFVVDPCHSWLTVGTSAGMLVCWDLRFQLPITSLSHPRGTFFVSPNFLTYDDRFQNAM